MKVWPSKASSCGSQVVIDNDKREQETTTFYIITPYVGFLTCPAQIVEQGTANLTSHLTLSQVNFAILAINIDLYLVQKYMGKKSH